MIMMMMVPLHCTDVLARNCSSLAIKLLKPSQYAVQKYNVVKGCTACGWDLAIAYIGYGVDNNW